MLYGPRLQDLDHRLVSRKSDLGLVPLSKDLAALGKSEYRQFVDDVLSIGVASSDGAIAQARSMEKHRALQAAIDEYGAALKRLNEVSWRSDRCQNQGPVE